MCSLLSIGGDNTQKTRLNIGAPWHEDRTLWSNRSDIVITLNLFRVTKSVYLCLTVSTITSKYGASFCSSRAIDVIITITRVQRRTESPCLEITIGGWMKPKSNYLHTNFTKLVSVKHESPTFWVILPLVLIALYKITSNLIIPIFPHPNSLNYSSNSSTNFVVRLMPPPRVYSLLQAHDNNGQIGSSFDLTNTIICARTPRWHKHNPHHFQTLSACDLANLTSIIGDIDVETVWKRWRFYCFSTLLTNSLSSSTALVSRQFRSSQNALTPYSVGVQ